MESFTSLMEFAVAIAGFSGITMAVQARNAVVSELQNFRNANLISFALAAAFGSAIPQVCAHLGANDSALWSWSSGLFSILCCVLLFLPFSARGSLSPESRAQLSPTIWVSAIGGTSAVVILQLANAVGMFGQPGPAPIYLGILWLIFLGALMYARLLFDLSRSSEG